MDNKQAAEKFALMGDLLELVDNEPFKARAHHNAARTLKGLNEYFGDLVEGGQLAAIPGFGKAIVTKLEELHTSGDLSELEALLAKLPPGVLQMRKVPGLGAKKLRQLYLENGIDSLEALEQAAADGTLEALPGFAAKSVLKVQDGIAQVRSFYGRWRRPRAMRLSEAVGELLRSHPGVKTVHPAGELRREMEIIVHLVWVVTGGSPDADLQESLLAVPDVEAVQQQGLARFTMKLVDGVTGEVSFVPPDQAGVSLLQQTGPQGYVDFVLERSPELTGGEVDIVQRAKLPWLLPECRDTEAFWEAGAPEPLLTFGDLRGVLHCHSTYSDGLVSIEDMARGAMERGLTYLGMCDHSRSAAYAGGLTEDEIRAQHDEIDVLNERFGDRFRIFKGIESDILADGSLDYPDRVLASFDFIVASVHSGLEMDEESATLRICRALENPYTTMLGHATGRLLLARRGFPLDWTRVLESAARCGVAIELNANPRRLDVDWRHLRDLFVAGISTSINPDAHVVDGLDDMHHGVAVARKAGTTPAQVINCMETLDLDRYFQEKRPYIAV